MSEIPADIITPQDRLRLNTQTQEIISRLKNGPITNVELSSIALKYTSRISDARKLGLKIKCTRVEKGITQYTLET